MHKIKKTNKTFMKYLLIILLLVTGFIVVYSSSFNVNAETVSIKDSNVYYNSVEKIIDISDTKICNITEIITVTYKKPGINLGLSRNISRVNKITRIVDGKNYVTKTINKLELLSVTMDDKPEYNFVEQSGDYFYINTGADGDYKFGKHIYKINYLYDMGEDFIDEFDDFTFDVMDYGFRSGVDNFSAQITLPKHFIGLMNNQITFRTNNMQPISTQAVNMQIVENTINMDFHNLPAKNGLTMQLLLPQKYFNTSYSPNALYYIIIGITIVCVIGIVLIAISHKFKRKPVITPEFYPPKNYSPMDVARSYRGKIKPKDFASLIIHWASKGYISIKFKSKKEIVLTKLKEYPKIKYQETLALRNKEESDYFNEIFRESNVYNTKENKYARNYMLGDCVRDIYKPDETITKKTILLKMLTGFLSILPLIFFIIWSYTIIGSISLIGLFIILFPQIAITVFVCVRMPIVFKIFWCGIFGGAPFCALYFALINTAMTYDVFSLFFVITTVFIIGNFSMLLIKVFTEEEWKNRGKVLGFKNFLVKVELNKLKTLIKENPKYYYDILPYCYTFGITKVMQKKFSALNVKNPDYFGSYTAVAFCSHINHSMSSLGGGSSGGSGGGGGGGSSGGGGGGGGCGGR